MLTAPFLQRFEEKKKMRFAMRPPKETFESADWVSRVKIDVREPLDESQRQGLTDIRYTVHHLEVFKAPLEHDSLPNEVYSSSQTGFTLEEGKEYLICGHLPEESRLSCIGGQIRPAGVEGMVAEWRELTPEFIEEMGSYEKRATVNAFYTIYLTGSFADILALLNAAYTYCSLTRFLNVHLIPTSIIVYVTLIIISFLSIILLFRISQAIVWGARFSQMITVLLIALNRLSAILNPAKYSMMRIFDLILQPIYVPSTLGGVITARKPNSLFLATLILQSVNAGFVVICYIIIIFKSRASVSTNGSDLRKADKKNSLHKAAFVICSVEQTVSLCIYIGRTAVYTSHPPYLLILFSKNIRKRKCVLSLCFSLTLRYAISLKRYQAGWRALDKFTWCQFMIKKIFFYRFLSAPDGSTIILCSRSGS
ncbi:hypothetical protein PRIPAC_79730, partial [Pristionchus pacificus]|uniref:Uncharacterized protein n=1 Tax=Pristionchus pacificus TaxID=54126 RepID=A0A2A6CPQ0_PRIPA